MRYTQALKQKDSKILEYENNIKSDKDKHKALMVEYKQLQNEKLEEEKKSNDSDGIQSVLNKLDGEFTKFKIEYNQGKLQNIMNQTPQKLLDKQSELNKALNTYKQCMDGIGISYKSFTKYIQDVDGIIDKLSSPDLANYKKWSIDTTLIWIRGLDNGRYVKYIDTLKSGMNESGIGAEDLPELTRGDLTFPPFNMTHFKDTRDLIQHFKSLSSPTDINANVAPAAADEGAPTAFIG